MIKLFRTLYNLFRYVTRTSKKWNIKRKKIVCNNINENKKIFRDRISKCSVQPHWNMSIIKKNLCLNYNVWESKSFLF